MSTKMAAGDGALGAKPMRDYGEPEMVRAHVVGVRNKDGVGGRSGRAVEVW